MFQSKEPEAQEDKMEQSQLLVKFDGILFEEVIHQSFERKSLESILKREGFTRFEKMAKTCHTIRPLHVPLKERWGYGI